MITCIKCGGREIHRFNCPSKNIFVIETENIDFALENEVEEYLKECEKNFNKYGFIPTNGQI